jgi:hypothetical protein
LKPSASNFTFDNNFFFYSALVLAATPIWLYEYMPGVDLPGHAAQIAALKELWSGNPLFTDEFTINLQTPYLVPTTIAAALSLFIPVGVSIRILLTIVVVSTGLLYEALAKAAGADPRWRWLVIPSSYGYAFYWGFLPFYTTVPMGLAFLLTAINFSRKPGIGMGLFLAAFSVALLASHILILSFASLLSLMWILGSHYREPLRVIKLSLPFTTPLPLIAWWLHGAMESGTYISDRSMVFDSLGARVLHLMVQVAGTDGRYLEIALLLSVAILAIPLLSRAKITKSPARWAMAITGLVVFMSFPSLVMGTAHVYQRFGVFLPVLYFLLWEKGDVETRRWDLVGFAAFLGWLALISIKLSLFNIEASGFDKIVQSIGPGKRVASMPVVNRSRYFLYPVYLHFPEWYQAKGPGVVDFNFAQFYNTVVTYNQNRRASFGDFLAWRPDYFNWETNGGDRYDYYLVRADSDSHELIFKGYVGSTELVRREGWWWLYRRLGTGAAATD